MHVLVGLALAGSVLIVDEGDAKSRGNAADSAIGKRIAEFKLQDYLGAAHALSDWRDRKLVVVAFVGTECPLAKAYGPRLAELAAEFEPKGVAFVGINANVQDGVTGIASYARTSKIEFALLKDLANGIADQFGATRTPEVFVLDAERIVRYHGRIDNQYGIGFNRPKPTRRDLATAIAELLDGKPVSVPETALEGCLIGRVRLQRASGGVTFSNQISRIFQRRCVGCHHPGDIAPFSLLDYKEAAGWSEMIREVLHESRMPPWHADPQFGHFANDARMPDEEKQLVYEWIKNGTPEGDRAELPPAPEFAGAANGWKIPKPDMIVTMPKPFTVPAKGVVDYQYIEFDPGFTEDRWVAAAEARPGNRAVVHHAVMFVQPPNADTVRMQGGLGAEMIAMVAPGMPPQVYSDGNAKFIPAGSKLVFQMHYTPCGTEQTDQTSVGLVFADPKKVKREVRANAALNFLFKIPAGADDHKVDATFKFSQDTLLYQVLPHMHLRGKSFRFEAEYPNGSTEVLLDVPRYEFDWQHMYVFAEPKRMPEGTKLRCTGRFDNSAANRSNPDPSKSVTFGLQTWQEMMVGYFDMALADQDLTQGGPVVRVAPNSDSDFDVTFRYRPPAGTKSVHLAGTFNEWKTDAAAMTGPDADGFFRTTVRLAAGRHEYKFMLDGTTWKHDPGNRRQAGLYNNSLLVVGEKK